MVFEWAGLEPNNFEPSKYQTCLVFESPLYYDSMIKHIFNFFSGLLERNDIKNVDYFIVIDFEATCEEKNPPGYPHEIIEFPAVLVMECYVTHFSGWGKIFLCSIICSLL